MSWAAEETPQPAMMVQNNMDVGLEYTLMVDGAVVDSTEGNTPPHDVQGRGQIIPGLERQRAGVRVGETKDVTVSPEEGYGPVDPAAFVEVPKTQLPKGVTQKRMPPPLGGGVGPSEGAVHAAPEDTAAGEAASRTASIEKGTPLVSPPR